MGHDPQNLHEVYEAEPASFTRLRGGGGAGSIGATMNGGRNMTPERPREEDAIPEPNAGLDRGVLVEPSASPQLGSGQLYAAQPDLPLHPPLWF